MKQYEDPKQFEGAKKIYQATEIPQELNRKINAAIDSAVPKRRYVWPKFFSGTVAACCAMLMIAVNTSQVFAQTLYDIPVLGSVARVFTFREYTQEDDSHLINAEIPSISGTGHQELEERINQEIQTRIDAILKEGDERGKLDKEAFLETGGKEEDFIPVIIDVNYEVKCSNESILSFVINKTETKANAYTEQLFYNIDLQTGKELTLKDLLGDDYIAIANESIRQQIAERSKDPNNAYFDGSEGIEGFSTIGENPKFYMNEKGNPVVCFAKYEIAPGYMGIQEFEIITSGK